MLAKFSYVLLAALMSVPSAYAETPAVTEPQGSEDIDTEGLEFLNIEDDGVEIQQRFPGYPGRGSLIRCAAASRRYRQVFWGMPARSRWEAQRSALIRCQRRSNDRCYVYLCQRIGRGRGDDGRWGGGRGWDDRDDRDHRGGYNVEVED